MDLFDILGPVMVGPSSSHTAGAVRIGNMGAALLGMPVRQAHIRLHGSFAATGAGHGTDRALVAGLLGLRPDDERIPQSFELAGRAGFVFDFEAVSIPEAHPNTVLLELLGDDGARIEVQASSLGGGRIKVDKLDGIPTDFSGDYNTLVIRNQDRPGCVGRVTTLLSDAGVNIANMRLFRGKRGEQAVTIIETDQPVPPALVEQIRNADGVLQVIYLGKEL